MRIFPRLVDMGRMPVAVAIASVGVPMRMPVRMSMIVSHHRDLVTVGVDGVDYCKRFLGNGFNDDMGDSVVFFA